MAMILIIAAGAIALSANTRLCNARRARRAKAHEARRQQKGRRHD